jgi:hypothetical protein
MCIMQFCFLAKFGLRCWANACNITGTATCLLQVSACHTAALCRKHMIHIFHCSGSLGPLTVLHCHTQLGLPSKHTQHASCIVPCT